MTSKGSRLAPTDSLVRARRKILHRALAPPCLWLAAPGATAKAPKSLKPATLRGLQLPRCHRQSASRAHRQANWQLPERLFCEPHHRLGRQSQPGGQSQPYSKRRSGRQSSEGERKPGHLGSAALKCGACLQPQVPPLRRQQGSSPSPATGNLQHHSIPKRGKRPDG